VLTWPLLGIRGTGETTARAGKEFPLVQERGRGKLPFCIKKPLLSENGGGSFEARGRPPDSHMKASISSVVLPRFGLRMVTGPAVSSIWKTSLRPPARI
jgi:hypothetical protein